jgi:hypothetical protein
MFYFFVILDSVMGSLQVQFGSSQLCNNAIIKFHTHVVISHCLTQNKRYNPTSRSTALLQKSKDAQLFKLRSLL